MFINKNKNIIYKIRNYAKHSILKKFELRTERVHQKETHSNEWVYFFIQHAVIFSSYYLLIFFNKSIVPETSSPSFLPKLTANSAYFLDSSFLDNL